MSRHDNDHGWIKLHRSLLSSEHWQNSTPIQRCILITLLLMVDRRNGTLVTTTKEIAKAAGAGVVRNYVKKVLRKLQEMGFIRYTSTKEGVSIKVVNWDTYQGGKSKKEVKKQPQKGSNLTKISTHNSTHNSTHEAPPETPINKGIGEPLTSVSTHVCTQDSTHIYNKKNKNNKEYYFSLSPQTPQGGLAERELKNENNEKRGNTAKPSEEKNHHQHKKAAVGGNDHQATFTPPTLEEVQQFVSERNLNMNPAHFFYFYQSKDWRTGRNRMNDWHAGVMAWYENRKRDNANKPPQEELDINALWGQES